MGNTGLICRKPQMLAYPTKIIFNRENIKDEDFIYYSPAPTSTYAYKYEWKKTAHATGITFGGYDGSDRPYGILDDSGNIETSRNARVDVDYNEKFDSTFKSLYLNPLATERSVSVTSRTRDTARVAINEYCPNISTYISIDSAGNLKYETPREYPYHSMRIPPYYYNGITTQEIDGGTYIKLTYPQIVYGQDTSSYSGAISEVVVGSGVEILDVYGCNSLKKIDIDTACRLKWFEVSDCINIKSIIVPDGVEYVNFSYLYSLESLQLPDSIRSIGSDGELGCYVKLFVDSVWDGNTVQDNGLKINNVCCHIGENLESQYEMLSTSKVILNCRIPYPKELTTDYLSSGHGIPAANDYCARTSNFISSCDFDNAIYIGSKAFQSDKRDVNLEKDVLCYANFANNTEQVELADYAFANSGLKAITLPKHKNKFGAYAFQKTRITHLDIPETWDNIEDRVFEGMDMLTSVYIPPTIKSIGSDAFNGSQLTEVTIAKDCACGDDAFPRGCTIKYYE